MKYVLWIALAGCTVDARQYTGPTIDLQLTNNGFDTVQSSDSMPSFTLGSDSQYSIDGQVFTHEGQLANGSSTKSSQVTTASMTFTLGGMTQPAVTLKSDGSELDPTFASTSPLVLPASALGGSLMVHSAAIDNNGVESNVVDLAIALQ